MTPEQVRELREAAETEMKFSAEACPPDHPLCKFYEVVRLRHRMLAQYVLTTVHADDALPVTADWLREEYGDNLLEPTEDYNVECYCYQFGDNDSCLNVEAESRRVYMYDAGSDRVISELEHITTRHQFRQLAGILGIQPKK